MILLLLIEKILFLLCIMCFCFQYFDGLVLLVFLGGVYVIVEMQDGDMLWCNVYLLVLDLQDGLGYEIVVQCEDQGWGGLCFMYEQVQLGMMMWLGQLVNLFGLNLIVCKYLLIVGGVGIMLFLVQIVDLDWLGVEYELYYVLCVCSELVVDLLGVYLYVSDEGLCMDLVVIFVDQFLGMYFYVCGLVWMIDSVLQIVIVFGWFCDVLYFEEFLVFVLGVFFVVYCVVSDQILIVGLYESLFEVMEVVGIDVLWLCCGGVCG